jgi:hypothetical protein
MHEARSGASNRALLHVEGEVKHVLSDGSVTSLHVESPQHASSALVHAVATHWPHWVSSPWKRHVVERVDGSSFTNAMQPAAARVAVRAARAWTSGRERTIAS